MEYFNPIQLTWSLGEPLNENQLSSHILSSRKNSTKVSKIVLRDDSHVFVGEQDDSPLSHNYLVIRNRKTEKHRWYKTHNFLVRPYRREREKKTPSASGNEVESKRDAMLNLNKIMGSKKIKRRVMETEKVNVIIDNIENKVKAAIEKEELVIEKPESTALASEDFPYLPPRDKLATSIELVYRLDNILSSNILKDLDEIAEDILNSDINKLADDDRLSSFSMKCYSSITKPDATRIKLLLFADNLMKFLKEPARNISKKSCVICKYCCALNAKILNEFCVSGLQHSRTRPPSMRDKAFCYILVCLFLMSNFVVDLGVFSGIVSTQEFQKLPMLMKAVGATKDRDSSTSFRLKLPLSELPTIKGGRKSGAFRKK